MVVCATGTGGTITGIARKLKEKCPDCKVIGVDPYGSILAEPAELNRTNKSYYEVEGVGSDFIPTVLDRSVIGVDPYGSILAEPAELNRTNQTFYEVEGVGSDFIPTVLDRSVVDRWYKCSDKPSFQMAKRLIREEGLLCGGSSGSAMYCAIQAAKDFGLKEGQRLVVLLPDSIRNYLTKFVSEDWMRARSFLDEDENTSTTRPWWWNRRVRDVLRLKSSSNLPITVGRSSTVRTVLKVMTSEKVEQIPVVDDQSNSLVGVVCSADLLSGLTNGRYDSTTTLQQMAASCQQFKKVSVDDTLGQLSAWLNIEPYVVAVSDDDPNKGGGDSAVAGRLICRLDLISFIAGTDRKMIINGEQ